MNAHIVPFNEANVLANQPWLTPQDELQAKVVGDEFNAKYGSPRLEPGRYSPLTHFILTPDFRIVQEPNFLRWGIFLERGLHRIIDKTDICAGKDRDRCDFDSWAAQQRHKRRRQEAPSFKIEETYVSTVFIGAHENELFETMIFGGWLNTTCWRSVTLEAAKKNHWAAVTLAHLLKRYIKRHGRSVRKDWVRLERFWRLGRKRGREWAVKHLPAVQRATDRLCRVPGSLSLPQPDLLSELAEHFLPRTGVPA